MKILWGRELYLSISVYIYIYIYIYICKHLWGRSPNTPFWGTSADPELGQFLYLLYFYTFYNFSILTLR